MVRFIVRNNHVGTLSLVDAENAVHAAAIHALPVSRETRRPFSDVALVHVVNAEGEVMPIPFVSARAAYDAREEVEELRRQASVGGRPFMVSVYRGHTFDGRSEFRGWYGLDVAGNRTATYYGDQGLVTHLIDRDIRGGRVGWGYNSLG